MTISNKTKQSKWTLATIILVAGVSIGCSPRQWLESENGGDGSSEIDDPTRASETARGGEGDQEKEMNLDSPEAGDRDRVMVRVDTSDEQPFSQSDLSTNQPLSPSSSNDSGGFQDSVVAETEPILSSENPAAVPTVGTRNSIDSNLTANELVNFIARTDRQTQAIIRDSGTPAGVGRTPEQNRAALLGILEDKRDAAATLAMAPDASAWQKIAGRRARLQSLSGLASLGDRDAGDLLRYAAATESHSEVNELAIDAHSILVALGVQSLVAGDAQAIDDILSHVQSIDRRIDGSEEIVTDSQIHDALSTLATLGAAREMLEKYGENDAALRLREIILKHYATSAVPQIAAVASASAGEARYRMIDQLLIQLVQGESVPMGEWAEAVNLLIDQAPDLQTVQYLAPSALELESYGRGDYADEIYRILVQRFRDADSDAAQQADIAIQAAQRRNSVLGQKFRPQLNSLTGPAIDLSDYRGRIVMMPFWASTSPESTEIIDSLNAIAAVDPARLAVVGMNLDLTQAQVRQLPPSSLPAIKSFAGSAPSQSVNPVAQQFGMVSLPFVAIIDGDGIVVGFGYDPTAIEQQIARLLNQES